MSQQTYSKGLYHAAHTEAKVHASQPQWASSRSPCGQGSLPRRIRFWWVASEIWGCGRAVSLARGSCLSGALTASHRDVLQGAGSVLLTAL